MHFPVKKDGIASLRHGSPKGQVSGEAARKKKGSFAGMSIEGLDSFFGGLESRMVTPQVPRSGGSTPKNARSLLKNLGDHPIVHQA